MGFLTRITLVVMLWPLLFTVAIGQDTIDRFELKGVLISPNGSAALINGEIAREGDRVDGAEVLSIGEKSVSILLGSAEYSILVGSSTAVHRAPARHAAAPARHAAAPARHAAAPARHAAYTVKRGDTLSGIAERFTGDGITMNQAMIALFEANPHAFDGNINLVREGAVLRVPPGDVIRSHSIAAATSEIQQQTSSWRAVERKPPKVAARQQYGPVSSGETLSGIAANVLREDATLNQMMMALFEANPHAFDGNINRLRRGMILRIPSVHDIHRWTHASATAAVLRHAESWRLPTEQVIVARI